MSKKTEVITFRTSEEVKSKLAEMAADREWSIAQAVDKICKEYFAAQEQEKTRAGSHEKFTYEKTSYEKRS